MNFSASLHPPAGRHHAAGDRPVPDRRRGLRLPAGREPADASNSRPSASRRAGPAPIRPSWRRPSRRRWSAGSARSPASPRSPRRARSARPRITVQFDLDRSIDGAARDVQAALNAALTDLPGDLPTLPTLPQGQSGRLADPDPGADLEDHRCRARSTTPPTASSRSASPQVEGVAEVTVSGAEQPAIRVRVDPARLASMGLSTRGRAHRDRQRQRGRRRSARSTARSRRTPSAPTTSFATPADYDPIVVKTVERHGGPAGRRRHDRARRAQQPLGRLVQPRAVGAAHHHQAGRRQRDRDGRPHLRRCCRSCKRWIPAGHRHLGAVRPHADDPRQRRATCSSRCWPPSRW